MRQELQNATGIQSEMGLQNKTLQSLILSSQYYVNKIKSENKNKRKVFL